MALKNPIERVIFLDIDGPIIPPKNLVMRSMLKDIEQAGGKLHGLTADFIGATDKILHLHDPIAVVLITHLALETNSKIVISSTWRGYGYDQFVEDFEGFGFDRSLLHEDWRTKPGNTMPRKQEVEEWLSRHPEVKKFVTIDDELLDFDEHVQVCAHNGFIYDNYNQAYELLTGEEPLLCCNLYTVGFVDFVGPENFAKDDPEIANGIKRLNDRKEAIRARYSKFDL